MEGKNPEEKPAAAPEPVAEKPVPKPKPKPKKAEVGPRFVVSSSPHMHDGRTVAQIMRLVLIALAPAALFSIYIFGLDALRVLMISIASALIFEAISQKIMKRPLALRDSSAMLTGLLLAMNLPSTSPWWLIVTGNFFAIVIAKQLYGGLGYNPFNPALVGRVVLLISFPVHMTARWVTNSRFGTDAVTTATPLTQMKESLATLGHIDIAVGKDAIIDLLIGNRAG
ncbi:MAG: RnfABCDGE type electron transport complex subunit D, partial [Candidatus Krumholzibacteria bacterium]|nr:RnfABCDGE type electron transport complex subunit D [Candidatus Krumholzibacteria bacterium]